MSTEQLLVLSLHIKNYFAEFVSQVVAITKT